MKNSFLRQDKTLITPLLSSQTEEALLQEIKSCIEQGATAFGLMIEQLPKELRTEEKMKLFYTTISQTKDCGFCLQRRCQAGCLRPI